MDFDAILNRITKAVNGFAGHVPETQRAMYREVLEAVQKLQVDKGKVKTSAANLSKLAGLKAKLMRLILTPEYKEAVKEYVKAFNEVTTLQNQYRRRQLCRPNGAIKAEHTYYTRKRRYAG
jgi:hypothetical protein